ncbi:MAG TPA: AtpZ/AtpI family protein [Candidatus Saccharimonadales bacterium]|nr:AtpZ/AtpI family protein [Candidatus Saccharimonadales bacterium]
MVKNETARARPGSDNEPNAYGGGAVFLAAALDMSWRLAIAVLVPIIGGHYLDEALNSSPWLTIIGFVVAFGGVIGVMRHVVADSNRRLAEFNSAQKGRK